MKTLFHAGTTLLFFILLAGCSSETNPIVGKWQMKKVEKEGVQSLEATYNLELKADKGAVANIDVMVEGSQEGFSMKLPISMGFEGTWNTNDNKLEIKADSTTTRIDIDKEKMEFKFDNPVMEKMAEQIKDLAFSTIGPQAKKDVAKQFIGNETMNYKLEGNKLILISAKDSLVFERQP